MGGKGKGSARPGTRRCRDCGAELVPATPRRRRCLPCVGMLYNRYVRDHTARHRNPSLPPHVAPTHTGRIKCSRCGRSEKRTWTTRSPRLCMECRGLSVVEGQRRRRLAVRAARDAQAARATRA